jgi:hypothetical protein
LLIGVHLRAELLSIFVRHTVRISEQSHRPIDIQVRTKAFGEPLGSVERDVIQGVQFEDDHRLDQLTDAEGLAWALVVVRVVNLVDEIPAEKSVHRGRSAKNILLGNRLQAFLDKCALVARARYPIECNVEYQKMIFQDPGS